MGAFMRLWTAYVLLRLAGGLTTLARAVKVPKMAF